MGDHKAAHELYKSVRNPSEAIKEYNEAMTFAGEVIYMTCSSRLQRQAATKLLCAIDLMQREKHLAREEGNNPKADYFFGLQCFSHALCHIVEMWVLLKDGKNLAAWTHKVDAEDYLGVAYQALSQGGAPHEVAENLKTIAALRGRIVAYDGSLFPPLSFTSPGFTYTKAHCSICGHDLVVCEHVEGQIYSGKVCLMVRMEGVVYNHLAFVTDPWDRRCVVSSFPRGKEVIDSFTRETIPGTPGQAQCILSRLTLLPDLSS